MRKIWAFIWHPKKSTTSCWAGGGGVRMQWEHPILSNLSKISEYSLEKVAYLSTDDSNVYFKADDYAIHKIYLFFETDLQLLSTDDSMLFINIDAISRRSHKRLNAEW